MKRIMADELRSLVAGLFRSRGLCERDAAIVADSLVHANLRGTDSHGVMRAPHYIQRLESGSINPSPRTQVTRTGPATGMADGDHGFGHVTNWDAMGAAIDIARETGIGLVGVCQSNHCGALSFFAYRAIGAGVIGMALTQTDKGVVPFGGRRPFCGTNPLCVGIPARSGPPIVLDMATSTVAGGHIYKARVENRPIPSTWALDVNGRPTANPHEAAYWTPLGGPKGYGLGVVIDVLTGILCGGAFGPHIVTMYGELDKKRNLCHLVGAIDPARFAGAEGFLDQVSAMIVDIHREPAGEGFAGVLAPGEPEHLTSLERAANGIPIEDAVWDDLERLTSS